MRVQLYGNEEEAPVGRFVGEFVGNVAAACAASLKAPKPKKSVRFDLRSGQLRLWIDDVSISVDQSQGFAQILIQDTLKGMVRSLKGMDPERPIGILVEFGS